MKFIHTEHLKQGMITAKALYDENGLLLPANERLTKRVIYRLKKVKQTGIYIYDNYSNYGDMNSMLDEQTRMDAVFALKNIEIDKIIYLANEIVGKLSSLDDLVIDLNELLYYDRNTYEHSVNVATLSATCGIGIGLNDKDLQELTLAAMLHDIGKRAIPKSIINKPGKLDEWEREIIETHARIGYDMISDNDNIPEDVKLAVLYHHENEDGTGYPCRIKGPDIPLYAKIIHVADVYDAMCRERSYKRALCSSESIDFLEKKEQTMFDGDIVNAFLERIVPFPVGTDVMLSNGRIGRVVSNSKKNPARPIVVTGHKIIDLSRAENGNLHVTEEINKGSVSYKLWIQNTTESVAAGM